MHYEIKAKDHSIVTCPENYEVFVSDDGGLEVRTGHQPWDAVWCAWPRGAWIRADAKPELVVLPGPGAMHYLVDQDPYGDLEIVPPYFVTKRMTACRVAHGALVFTVGLDLPIISILVGPGFWTYCALDHMDTMAPPKRAGDAEDESPIQATPSRAA